jgi:DNA-binding transcriptional ArsR family regulator
LITDLPVQSLALKAKFFRGFSDASRLAIIEALRAEPLTVGEIVQLTGLSQSNVSNHLSCLNGCGLVLRSQEGRFVRYRLRDERVSGLLDLADQLLAEVARDIYACTHPNMSL